VAASLRYLSSRKLLERLALQRISPTVEGLLSPDHAGFRKGRSTCDQVAALTTFIENGFQQNLKTGTAFLDLTAAYDTVWHTGLLYELSKSGLLYKLSKSGSVPYRPQPHRPHEKTISVKKNNHIGHKKCTAI